MAMGFLWQVLSTCEKTAIVVFNYQKVCAADMPGLHSTPASRRSSELVKQMCNHWFPWNL